MARTCDTCGSAQGPFSRIFVGYRKTGQWVFTCPVPIVGISDAKRKEISAACNNRKEKRNAAA